MQRSPTELRAVLILAKRIGKASLALFFVRDVSLQWHRTLFISVFHHEEEISNTVGIELHYCFKTYENRF